MAQKLDEAAERYRRADAECRKAMADLGDALDALGETAVGHAFENVLGKMAEIAREESKEVMSDEV